MDAERSAPASPVGSGENSLDRRCGTIAAPGGLLGDNGIELSAGEHALSLSVLGERIAVRRDWRPDADAGAEGPAPASFHLDPAETRIIPVPDGVDAAATGRARSTSSSSWCARSGT